MVRRVVILRDRGLSMGAALERARGTGAIDARPSIYAVVSASSPGVRPQLLRKRTLIGLSAAIEDEALAQGAQPLLFAAFQQERFYRAVAPPLSPHRADRGRGSRVRGLRRRQRTRWRAGRGSDPTGEALGNEWAVIVDAPGYSACLLAWERPDPYPDPDMADRDRTFETLWTVDPAVTRRAAHVAARLAGRADPGLGQRLEALLADRPLAFQQPPTALIALTNRMIGYLETSNRPAGN